ncbi:LOW QUALITY PROTEIN: schwannomin-interacting protein 1-like [Daphnia carinata]|uniref:LOW QUALITY PROTEIN: schwannomin-interacting protein 1-like n=1 Tax=Daphnia carinata TaxID=120202 RepID=UPI0025803281|nr:LOW QUALITY PROTEIN: schwannomin-interacting protein 1-like [Daphnia carinata]
MKERESMNNYTKSVSQPKECKGELVGEVGGGFDVYNVETALPKIEWETVEANLRAANDEEKRKRNDREEIRRRLAMGVEAEDGQEPDKIGKKPSLQSRLQSGMNLQICFMNETADGSEIENQRELLDHLKLGSPQNDVKNPYVSLPNVTSLKQPKLQQELAELDFFSQQAKLQMEARTALAQAKELARVQMQVERQQRKHTRISDLVRQSLEKLGIPFPWDCRRLSRQILTELNIAQLQVIVNDLHTQIEGLNEELVQLLLKRDDCHMEQDSMLVDIEDLTRFLTAKQTALDASSRIAGPVSLPVHAVQMNSPSP